MRGLSYINILRTIYWQREIACTTKSEYREEKARTIIKEANEELKKRGRNYEKNLAYREKKIEI
jgi:hypothetical protein